MMRDHHVRLPQTLFQWLADLATERGLSVNKLMGHILQEYMDHRHQYVPSANPNDQGDCAICGNPIGAHMPVSTETQKPLTAAQLADALGYFWNASIGEAHRQQEGITTASIMATGFAAVQQRLEEISRDT